MSNAARRDILPQILQHISGIYERFNVARIFISHSSKDAVFVVEYLKPLLEHAGMSVWCSSGDLEWGVDWERQLHQELRRADWFIVVLSPDAADSDWVRAEVHWAMEKRKGSIVPVMLHTCDPSAIHLRLGIVQFVDFRSDLDASATRLLNWLQGNTVLSFAHQTQETRITPLAVEPACRVTLLFDLTIDNSASRPVSLSIDRQCVLGRGVDVDFTLASATVSRYHARLTVINDAHGKQLEITDLQSSNGTYVNDERISGARCLQAGDRVVMGTALLNIRQLLMDFR
ncbi:FHA domain-containing protein [Allochromatium warmingii]|uniref:FHA domain-containing protein n=1 Tax=Allochromatium warmingii TaxID=61595 RepID=A0A1H3FQ99_ALLWA|nr:TIR domain-containing protein [Allochromatium warmingii]SDX93223.1 FHA domain-containing protein [Allochromatium warmingii]